MIGLLRLLREHPDAVEADLSRYYGIDIRDRWRFDADGQRRLTLRMIWVRVHHLPREAATVEALLGKSLWSPTDELLDEIRIRLEHLGGQKNVKPHPGRAAPAKPRSADRERKLNAARRRARERRRRITAGEIS